MKKKILRIILTLLIICWMYMVFVFSNAGGSESSGISMRVAELFIKNEEYIEIAEKIIRKIAHLSEYAFGAILVYLLMLTFKLNAKIQFLCSWIFIVLYAIIDEVHQLFIPGRSGRAVDVFIDSIGALIGMCVILFIIKIFQLVKQRLTKC